MKLVYYGHLEYLLQAASYPFGRPDRCPFSVSDREPFLYSRAPSDTAERILAQAILK